MLELTEVPVRTSANETSPELQVLTYWQPLPTTHVSVVQASVSAQRLWFGTLLQLSVLSLQESAVQATASAQFTAEPAWQPSVALQVSVPLQKNPSLQAALFGVWVQLSVNSLQESVVQAVASSQPTGVPDRQLFATQVSTPLQNSVSLQSASTRQFTH